MKRFFFLMLSILATATMLTAIWNIIEAGRGGFAQYPSRLQMTQKWGVPTGSGAGRKTTITLLSSEDLSLYKEEVFEGVFTAGSSQELVADVAVAKTYNASTLGSNKLFAFNMRSEQSAARFLKTSWSRDGCQTGPVSDLKITDGGTFSVGITNTTGLTMGLSSSTGVSMLMPPGSFGEFSTQQRRVDVTLNPLSPGSCWSAVLNLDYGLASSTTITGPAEVQQSELVEVTVDIENLSTSALTIDSYFRSFEDGFGPVVVDMIGTADQGSVSSCGGDCPIRWQVSVQPGSTQSMAVEMHLVDNLPDEFELASFEGADGSLVTINAKVEVPTLVKMQESASSPMTSREWAVAAVIFLLVLTFIAALKITSKKEKEDE